MCGATEQLSVVILYSWKSYKVQKRNIKGQLHQRRVRVNLMVNMGNSVG
jgi:hypothetical protein